MAALQRVVKKITKSGDNNVNKQQPKAMKPFTIAKPCHKDYNHQLQNIPGVEFPAELTGKYQQATVDRKQCWMCVRELPKEQYTKHGTTYYYPRAKAQCPNLNSNQVRFTGPHQDEWRGEQFTAW